jgi:ribonuclease HI
MMATSGNKHTKNPKTRKIRQLMEKRKGNEGRPGHAGITENEKVDDEAKRALEKSISNDENYPPEGGNMGRMQ